MPASQPFPNQKPQPAPEPRAQAVIKPPEAIPRPAVIHRLTDTGIEWVTDVSDLKSRHRFQHAQHIIEANGATRYHGGSVADIGVRARLRAVGLYRDGVIVANAIYIVRSAQPVPVQTGTASKAPNKAVSQAAKPAAPYQSVRTPSVSTAPPSSSGKLEKAGVEKTVAKPMRSQSAVRANTEKAKGQYAIGQAKPRCGGEGESESHRGVYGESTVG